MDGTSSAGNQPDQRIIMLRRDMEALPGFSFPGGFSARHMKPKDVAEWISIWRELEPPGKISDELFEKQFGTDWGEIEKRCFLILSPDGSSAGTISAWFDNSFKGGEWGRIHWVALRKDFQGKGLAKPMLSMAMEKLASMHKRCYLVTQTYRIPAISLYLKFGFLPDISSDEDCKLWRQVAKDMEAPALKELLLKAIG
ncbi:MAG: hypothetical protein A2X49_12135 [Lentisphaerae bacterium GWF2_52_8]|nr:MAG: hypothetical protein A2X49_12135 [Lentisphaerae bacterium GWF2_52_8]